MDSRHETSTSRIVTLMTPREKASLEAKARKAGLSVGEVVRRSVEAYDPEEMRQLEEIADFARAFRESAERASAAVDATRENIAQTLNELRARRQP